MISPGSYARQTWNPIPNEEPGSRLHRLLDHERQDSVGIAPADHEPTEIGLTSLRAAAAIPDDHVAAPDRLLCLDDGDTAGPELVQGGLSSEQLVDGVGHPLSMIDAWDIPAGQSSSDDLIQAENGGGEIRTLGTPIRRTTVFETTKIRL
jgi:hypothetical protein